MLAASGQRVDSLTKRTALPTHTDRRPPQREPREAFGKTDNRMKGHGRSNLSKFAHVLLGGILHGSKLL